MTNLKTIRAAGFHAYKHLWQARLMAYYYSRVNMQVYWVFADPGTNLVLSLFDAELIGKLQPNGKKLRVRDMNRMAKYRYPDKTWGILKKAK